MAKPVHPDWVLALEGADIVLGRAALLGSGASRGRSTSRCRLTCPSSKAWPTRCCSSTPDQASFASVESRMDLLVAMAREQGRSWTEIGRALGVTKQTAWARLSRVVAEGKTKTVEDAGNGEVFVRSKDDITAGDGAKHDVLDGKAAASTRTTSNIFRLLERNGVRTHFVDRVDDVTFRARTWR